MPLSERAKERSLEAEEENTSLRRDRVQLDMEKRDLQSSLDEAKAESRKFTNWSIWDLFVKPRSPQLLVG